MSDELTDAEILVLAHQCGVVDEKDWHETLQQIRAIKYARLIIGMTRAK